MGVRTRLLGLEVDPLRMPEAVGQVLAWIRAPDGICRYVVTPNVDHVVLLRENASLRAAYRSAGLILADGAPVIWASRLLGKPLPERVPGSDLVPALFSAVTADKPLRVYLLGAGPGVARRAAEQIEARWPAIRVCGTYSPPLGFEFNAAENRRIVAAIGEAQADLLIVGLGAPKQEVWVHQYHADLNVPAALCVGATIDFLAGEKSRAPVWMRKCGLEWVHRVLSEPRRLASRYARDAWVFPQIVVSDWWQSLPFPWRRLKPTTASR
jgi:N-acetylglucosaminyldiphosphoundecaprenol N-acetyl-beta-D-mannosaminyltransferase